jgi:FMN phosphatase YigB (HAD superfamily)
MVEICADWHEAAARARLELPSSIGRSPVLRRVRDIADRHESGHIDAAAFDRQVAEVTGLTTPQVSRIAEAWLKAPYRGLDELLERLGSAGVRTACLSNTNDRHWGVMNEPTSGGCALPLDRLDHRFASHLIGRMKPDEEIYAHVEQACDVSAESILFFDDNEQNCRAARRLGWQAEQIDPADDPAARMTEHLVRWGVIGR